MADKPIQIGSITKTADLLGERAGEVSNVSKTVNEMQRDVNQRITEVEQQFGDADQIKEVQEATVGILRKMSSAMGSFADGVTSITAGVATSTKDAISQYGKAISEDISYNKQSIVATALSRTTPLFGYFAAKFMETDVFQTAKERMKKSIGQVFSGVGKTISGFVKGKEKAEPVPKMQHGGYVEKGGMVEVHAGEIVAPIEKVLDKVDATVSATQDLAKITKRAQLNTLAKMGTFVRTNEEMQKVGLFKGFMRAMRQVQTQYEEPANIRSLRALLAIQDTLGATIGTWPQVWQKMLITHPTFRNIMFSLRTMGNIFLNYPARLAYGVFKSRGGYTGHLSQKRNPYEQLNYNVGLLYSEGMWRLDNIAKFTRATATASRDLSSFVTGTKYAPLTGVPSFVWSLAGLARSGLRMIAKPIEKWIIKQGEKKGGMFGLIARALTVELEAPFVKLINMLPSVKEMQDIYGKGTGLAGGGVMGYLPQEDAIVKIVQGQLEPLPVKMIEYDGDVMDAEIIKTETSKDTLSGINSLYEGWKKQHKVQKKQLGLQKIQTKTIKEMNAREKLKFFMGLLLKPLALIKQGVMIAIGAVGAALAKLGLSKGFLGKFLSGAKFAKFLGPAVGVIMAAGLGVAIGTWINKYVGPWLNKKWDQMFAESRKAQGEVVDKSFEASKVARKTEGIKGLTARYQTALTARTFQQQKQAGYGTDPKLGLIQKGQQEYFNANISEYLKYPVDSLSAFRNEWMASGQYGTGGYGPRAHIFGWGTDPIEYGKRREMNFLMWLQKNKKGRSEAEIQAEANAWSKRVRSAQGVSLSTLTTVADKAGTYIADKYKIAEGEFKEGVAAGYVAAEAIREGVQEQVGALKDQAKEFGTGMQHQTTQIVTSVTDNSQRMVKKGSAGVQNLYNNLRNTVITGKTMDDPIMFD